MRLYSKCINLYKQPFDMAFPIRTIKVGSRNIKREPWMTAGLLNYSRHKSKLFLKKLKKPTKKNILEYKIYLKLFNKIKRKARIFYYKTVLDQNRHNTKQTWNILKKAIGKENNNANFPQSFNIYNNTVRNKNDIAHAFNKLFANIGYNVNHSVPQSNTSFTSYFKYKLYFLLAQS